MMTKQLSGTKFAILACVALVCAALSLSLAPIGASKAYAGDSFVTAQATTTKAAKAKKKKRKGNLDKYIGLKKRYWVIATGRVSVTVRKKASLKSDKVSSFQRKSCIVVDTTRMKAGKRYKWIKVKLRGSKRGYVKLSHVKLKIIDTKTFGLDISKKKNRRRVKILRYGLRWLGNPYSHAGGPISVSCDCGAYVKFCYRNGGGYQFTSGNLGYLLHKGKAVSRKRLKPGDMVFYPNRTRSLAHAAIYLGYGLIINESGAFGSSYPRGGVRISTLDYRSPTCNRFRNYVDKKNK